MSVSKRSFLLSCASYLAFPKVDALASGFDDSSYPHLLQGPMIGAACPSEVLIWTRVNGEYDVEIQIDTEPDFSRPVLASRLRAKSDSDFITLHQITNLASNTIYYYRVLVNRGKHLGSWARRIPDPAYLPPFHFRTAPAEASKFRIAFGSCARIQADPIQPVWHAVDLWKPDLFFWLGDNIYSDSSSPEIIAEHYRRQRNVGTMQKISRSVPQLSIWDDHDYGRNNYDRTNPIKRQSLDVFKRYWANPAYGLPDVPGVFYDYHYGGVDFFFLDGRYARDPNAQEDNRNKSLLGAEQKKWLKKKLLESEAPFKILICGSGWSDKGGPGDDSWSAFLTERNEIFDFIKHHNISGVVLLSGDTHVGELNVIPWSDRGGYDFYDLVSSPLAQPTGDSFLYQDPQYRMRKPYAGTTNFGVIDFDLTSKDPSLIFKLIGVHGGAVWEPFTLKASELTNGVMTWKNKIQ